MSDTRIAGPDDAFFWAGAAEDRLLIQRCAECGVLRHPPAPMCGTCGSLEWDALEASGRGRVHSWMFSLHPNRPDEPARVVILVQLDEGARLVSNLVDPPHGGPYDDLEVEVEFRDDRGTRTPFFRVVGP
ncbi:MAG: hypothetical protein QOF40_2754 [Actinomycetota bacterium]|nr:hypothetical protein [Actinomycetota bacterium]